MTVDNNFMDLVLNTCETGIAGEYSASTKLTIKFQIVNRRPAFLNQKIYGGVDVTSVLQSEKPVYAVRELPCSPKACLSEVIRWQKPG